MSATYPDIDVTDEREPLYDDEFRMIQDDIYFTTFCKDREAEAIEHREKFFKHLEAVEEDIFLQDMGDR